MIDKEFSERRVGLATFSSPRRWLIAIAAASYLYFLLPATAVLFYELYHLTGIEIIYWAYSAFKFTAYYFGIWSYRELTCLLVVALVFLVPLGWRTLKGL